MICAAGELAGGDKGRGEREVKEGEGEGEEVSWPRGDKDFIFFGVQAS